MASSGEILCRESRRKTTECSICMESFEEPKILPCGHTFCLQCIDQSGPDKTPGDKATCSLCRRDFSVPRGGYKDLPTNHVIVRAQQPSRVADIKIESHQGGYGYKRSEHRNLRTNRSIVQSQQPSQMSVLKSAEQNVACEMCPKEDSTITYAAAHVYCLECRRNLCGPCCWKHMKYRLAKGHQVVSLQEKKSADELIKIAPSYCAEHTDKVTEFFCYNCRTTACIVCLADHKLSKHKCCDLKELAEKYRVQLKDDIDTAAVYALQRQDNSKQLDNEKQNFTNLVSTTKREITRKCAHLRSLIRKHETQILAELDAYEKHGFKALEMKNDEVERETVIVESFRSYCIKMKDEGTPCDVLRSSNDLRVKTEEMAMAQQDYNKTHPFSLEIPFTPFQISNDNLIGKLQFQTNEGMRTVWL